MFTAQLPSCRVHDHTLAVWLTRYIWVKYLDEIWELEAVRLVNELRLAMVRAKLGGYWLLEVSAIYKLSL